VLKLLQDAEWSTMPFREMARHCAVNDKFVRKLHDEVSAVRPQIAKPTVREVTRGGKTFTQDTAAIGKRPAATERTIVSALMGAPASRLRSLMRWPRGWWRSLSARRALSRSKCKIAL
jgi:hypothetical protein